MDGVAAKADIADILAMQNLGLEGQVLQLKQELFRRSLIEKYGSDVTGLQADGTIIREATAAAATGGG